MLRVQKQPADDELVCSKHGEDSIVEINKEKSVHLVGLSHISMQDLHTKCEKSQTDTEQLNLFWLCNDPKGLQYWYLTPQVFCLHIPSSCYQFLAQ
jgi:hypothetical protein